MGQRGERRECFGRTHQRVHRKEKISDEQKKKTSKPRPANQTVKAKNLPEKPARKEKNG